MMNNLKFLPEFEPFDQILKNEDNTPVQNSLTIHLKHAHTLNGNNNKSYKEKGKLPLCCRSRHET